METRKIKTQFKVKDSVKHKADINYKGTSAKLSEVTYIVETSQNAAIRWNKHLLEHKDEFIWKVLTTSSSNWLKRSIFLQILYKIRTFYFVYEF